MGSACLPFRSFGEGEEMRMPGRGMYAVVLADSEFLAVGEGLVKEKEEPRV
jgi:hypothetical protein